MQKKFEEHSDFNLSEINKQVLEEWDKNHASERSVSEHEGFPHFTFYEGPPSANGHPGIHHVLARTIKDTICRYKTMKGYQVKRKAGWDTHGLPVELSVEKALGITKEDIGKKISVADYNAACRKDVMKYTKEWEDLTHRMGYWVDMKHPYITYDNRYIETLWWLLKQLHKKGLLYKGYTIQPYSPAAGTGLSSHELNQPGCYRDVKDTTAVAQFKMKNPKPEMTEWGTPYFLAWTTTPWTLPSNTALCVGPKIDYVAVQTYNGYTGEKMTVVLAKALLYTHFNKKAEELALEDYKPGDKLIPFKVVGEYKGPDLVGMEYEQLIPWVKPVTVDENGKWQEAAGEAFRVIPGDYVTTEAGTGCVHTAPGHGDVDFETGLKYKLPILCPVDSQGKLTEEAGERFKGMSVFDANIPVLKYLAELNCLLGKENIKHQYAHCWRCKNPIIFRATSQWFASIDGFRDEALKSIDDVQWIPSWGQQRIHNMVSDRHDWCISRQRVWGVPIPVFYCDNCGEHLINEATIDSVANWFEKEGSDAWWAHTAEELLPEGTVCPKCGSAHIHQDEDALDTWFSSALWPFSTMGWPDKTPLLKQFYPTSVLVTGYDIIFFWVARMLIMGMEFMHEIPFDKVFIHGLVRDSQGRKMSKSLGNGIDPLEMAEKYGADALRLNLIFFFYDW